MSTPRQITTPLDSPLEGAPRTASYLWLYPGLAGTPLNPLPGPWPTPRQVVDACCRVMDVDGREAMRMGRERLLPDHIFGRRNDELAQVTRMLALHILRDRCRWYSTPDGPPMRYTFKDMAAVFSRSVHAIWSARDHAAGALLMDARLMDLYQRIVALLSANYLLERNRPVVEQAGHRA